MMYISTPGEYLKQIRPLKKSTSIVDSSVSQSCRTWLETTAMERGGKKKSNKSTTPVGVGITFGDQGQVYMH